MGGSQSSPLQQCLNNVCDGRSQCVAYPDTPLYQIAWVKRFNLDIEVEPLAVFRPNNAQDVSEAIKCATEEGAPVQARSGGHSYANFGLGGTDGAVVIDLVNLQDFSMNTDTWEATFGSGFRLGDLDEYLHDNGKRAMAHGTCPSVGIGGHATIGGLGPMSRMWGSALDHVLEVEVVTADGEIRRASADENEDLFWALRGAGASFGVITEFTVKTHPEPADVVEYTYSFSFGSQSDMAPVFAKWQAMAGDIDLDPRFSSLLIAQPLGIMITGTFYGTNEEYEATGIEKKLPGGAKVELVMTDWLGSLAHEAETAGLSLGALPSPFYSQSLAFGADDLLDDDAITSLFEYMDDADKGTLLWFVIFNTEGGAMNDFSLDHSAYPHRDKLIMYQSYAIGLGALTSKTREFVHGIHERIAKGAPNATSTYAGYIDHELSQEEANKMYWSEQLPRLRDIKKEWDPNNVFKNPHSVQPAKS